MTHKILIIEDDSSLSQMLTLHFEDQGMEVQVAHSCGDALDQAEQFQPDLILLDQQLPDGLGNELIPRLLALAGTSRIIMMTGVHDLELAIQAIQDGAADFIHKPVNEVELLGRIKVALSLFRERRLRDSGIRQILLSEERYRSMVNQAPVGLARVDSQGRMMISNDTLQDMLGRTGVQLQDSRLDDF